MIHVFCVNIAMLVIMATIKLILCWSSTSDKFVYLCSKEDGQCIIFELSVCVCCA